MQVTQQITPCLWFDDQAEEAADVLYRYLQELEDRQRTRYGEAGHEVHGKPAGTVMTVAFELDGQAFTALNGGPLFKFNEAISFQVHCATQEEVDYYWEKLSAGGDEGPAVRLAEGQIRRVVASRSQRVPRVFETPIPQIPTRHAGHAADEEARH